MTHERCATVAGTAPEPAIKKLSTGESKLISGGSPINLAQAVAGAFLGFLMNQDAAGEMDFIKHAKGVCPNHPPKKRLNGWGTR
jgi:hypothetical protein